MGVVASNGSIAWVSSQVPKNNAVANLQIIGRINSAPLVTRDVSSDGGISNSSSKHPNSSAIRFGVSRLIQAKGRVHDCGDYSVDRSAIGLIAGSRIAGECRIHNHNVLSGDRASTTLVCAQSALVVEDVGGVARREVATQYAIRHVDLLEAKNGAARRTVSGCMVSGNVTVSHLTYSNTNRAA